MLSRLVIAFLSRSKRLLISWLSHHVQWFWRTPKIKSVTVSIVPPSICHEVMGPDAMFFVFWMLSFTICFTFLFQCHQKALQLLFTFCHKGGVFCISEVIDISSSNLNSSCASSNPAFCMVYSAYKLNKQGDNIHLWSSPFPTWNQSIVLSVVLTVVSWPAYRFLRRQVRWSGTPISLRVFHSLLWSTWSKVSVLSMKQKWIHLEFPCFCYDPRDVVILISGSSTFFKSSLYIWKSSFYIPLKPSLKDFESYFASVWNEDNSAVTWTFFGITRLWYWRENWPFPVL